MKKVWVRFDFNTNEPLAVADSFKRLQQKRSEWIFEKGEDRCVYDREYAQLPEEGLNKNICGKEHYPKPLRFCPHCGEKLFIRDEEMFESNLS